MASVWCLSGSFSPSIIGRLLPARDGGSPVGAGTFDTKTGTVPRPVFPAVLGLGGWFVGVLVVLAVRPALFMDVNRLAVFAIGLPMGAGIALARLNPNGRFTRQARNAFVRDTGFA